jgi:hypothetical protein
MGGAIQRKETFKTEDWRFFAYGSGLEAAAVVFQSAIPSRGATGLVLSRFGSFCECQAETSLRAGVVHVAARTFV